LKKKEAWKMTLTIDSTGEKLRIDIRRDKPLSFLIQQAGIPLDLQCSGLGICGKCAVFLGEGEYEVSGETVKISKGEEQKALSCRTKILSDHAVVRVPPRAVLKTEGKIYDDFELDKFNFAPLTRKILVELPESSLEKPVADWDILKAEIKKRDPDVNDLSCCLDVLRKFPLLLEESRTITATIGRFHKQWDLIDVESGDTAGKNLGLAVDIGTTTVAALLVDMNTGKVLSKASAYNQQMSRADDVASRISVASNGADELKYMKDLVVNDTINKLIKELCEKANRKTDEIQRMAVSGNTVMSHLFLGLSPKSIGVLPFQPVTNVYADSVGSELGISMHGCGIVNIVPSISGYIGGDITSDIYVSGLDKTNDLTALVDLGTNSEMALAENGEILTAAAAAGPAFEGAGMLCGCRASKGAIEHIDFDESLDFKIQTIGDAKAIGICGSAIIDFIAKGYKCGLINPMGRFDLDMLKKANRYVEADICGRKSHACLLASEKESETGEPVLVAEGDIEQILKAKAAVYAGLKTLLSEKGKTFKDLKKIILAGGFAKYINVDNAITMGMLPDLPSEIYQSIGNGSLAGAFLALIDPDASKAYLEIIDKPKVTALNLIPEFEMSFVDALMIPNYNESEFGQVKLG
jgi:uncharacterized 2Fe-2S/4Fe-4S cluster protein (DUF4445 family)